MKIAIKLDGFDLTIVPYETRDISGFPYKQSAEQMCKDINSDLNFAPHHWVVEERNQGGLIRWLIVAETKFKPTT